jgi:hypothetical protein
VAPSPSRAQREDALRRATAVRRQRAQLKRDLKVGRCAIEEVLTDPPAFVQTAKVADLLLVLPKYGPVKVNKLLSRCRIAPSKTIGGARRTRRRAGSHPSARRPHRHPHDPDLRRRHRPTQSRRHRRPGAHSPPVGGLTSVLGEDVRFSV